MYFALKLCYLVLAALHIKIEETKVPALFETRKEAKKAAKSFNCTGAHKMGNKWMPWATHGLKKQHST